MSPMNRAARRVLPLLILFCSCSARLFAGPLITHPLGISTGANSLLDVPSGGNRFWLSSSAGTAGVQNGPRSVDGFVGVAGGSASDQGSAQTGESTSRTEGNGQPANTGPVRQVTIQPDGAALVAANGRPGPINPPELATRSRMLALDPVETNRASPGQVSSASTPVPSLAVSSPAVSSQQAATPPGQSGSVSSSQASQAVSNPPGTASSPPSAQLNPAGAAPMAAGAAAGAGAGTPAASSSSAAPSNSVGATALAATPQSGGSTPPASVAGASGAPGAGTNQLSSGSTVAQSPQSSSPSTVSIAPSTASMFSAPPATTPATAGVGSANPSGVSGTDDHLAAQFLIALSPSLTSMLGGSGSAVAATSNAVSTTTATSALSTGGTTSSIAPTGSLASSDLPLPSVELASQILVNPAPDATSTGLVNGILPQNIPEPRVLDMLMVLATVLALRHVCWHGVSVVRAARGFQSNSATATGAARRALETSRAWLARKF